MSWCKHLFHVIFSPSILFCTQPHHTSSLPSHQPIFHKHTGRANALGGECIVRQNELLSSFGMEGSAISYTLCGLCVGHSWGRKITRTKVKRFKRCCLMNEYWKPLVFLGWKVWLFVYFFSFSGVVVWGKRSEREGAVRISKIREWFTENIIISHIFSINHNISYIKGARV